MNQKPKRPNPNDFDLLLSIPHEWAEELDTLAYASNETRLSLIRRSLRNEIDKGFANLKTFLESRQNVRQVRANTNQWLRKVEERKRSDRW